MAWHQNLGNARGYYDERSRLTVFGRLDVQTYASVRSPDGTEWFIQVDNAGNVSTGEPVTASGFDDGFDEGFGF